MSTRTSWLKLMSLTPKFDCVWKRNWMVMPTNQWIEKYEPFGWKNGWTVFGWASVSVRLYSDWWTEERWQTGRHSISRIFRHFRPKRLPSCTGRTKNWPESRTRCDFRPVRSNWKSSTCATWWSGGSTRTSAWKWCWWFLTRKVIGSFIRGQMHCSTYSTALGQGPCWRFWHANACWTLRGPIA